MAWYTTIAVTILLSLVGLTLLIRRNLRQRPIARAHRDRFISLANDLVAKAEFPEAHARLLINFASLPQGWMTRLFVASMFKHMIVGPSARKKKAPAPKLDQVPHHLRANYVVAMLSFMLSDSYRCALLGRIFRSTNSWLFASVKEVKPDVDAHATRDIVDQAAQVQAPRARRAEYELACVG